MQMKADWLCSRREQLLKDIQETDLQQKELINTLILENLQKDKELTQLKEEAKGQTDAQKDQLMKCITQIRSLQAVLNTKQTLNQNLKQQNEQLATVNLAKQSLIEQQSSQLLQLQHSLSVIRQQKQKENVEWKKQLSAKQYKFQEQMAKLARKCQEELREKQKQLSKAHENELIELRKNNLKLIEKIQNDYQSNSVKLSENGKQIEGEYGRIVGENNKLMGNINEYKLKSINFQANLNAAQQQIKIIQKELQIFKENSKRQIDFLKQERTSLLDKNKKLTQKVDELSWIQRQSELKKQEQIATIRKQVDKSFKQVLQKAEAEISERQKQNDSLQRQLQQKHQQIKQLQDVSLRIKQLFQTQENQIQKIKEQKENLLKVTKENNYDGKVRAYEELKNQIIKKNCEIQVLQDEIKRLKIKINSIVTSQEEYLKQKQNMLKQNKMLLSQIVFLREKQKKGKSRVQRDSSGFLSEMESERSVIVEDVQEYKKMIKFMTDEMNDVLKKIQQKDTLIEKQRQVIQRLERLINN